MDTSKVEVTFGWNIGDISCNSTRFAQFPDFRRSLWIVNGAQHHIHPIQVVWLEIAVNMSHLLFSNPKSNLLVQPGGRAYDCYPCVGVEGVEDAPRSDLSEKYRSASCMQV